MKKGFLLLIFWSIFLLSPFCSAANPLDVVINEITWMGTKTSYNDEWIELYNNTNETRDLSGWILKADDGTPEINLTEKISANGFYLLERTDDNTLPNIPADQIYTGALGNKGEVLELYDSSGSLIDSLNCSSGWFAGDNTTKQTMERKNPRTLGDDSNNWATSKNPGGTPKTENSVLAKEVIKIEGEPIEVINEVVDEVVDVKHQQPKAEPEPKEEELKPIIYPSGIVINEILPSPEGPDETEEWIEIFNQNDFEVNLFNWQIKDNIGKVQPYRFLEGTKISAKGFLVFSRPTTKITLNNDGDGLSLFQPDGKNIDQVSYQKATKGQSYNRIGEDWSWSSASTPGSENIVPNQIPEEETQEIANGKGVATIGPLPEILKKEGQSGKPTSRTLSVLLISFLIAIFSGIIILIIKKKINLKSEIE